MTEVGALIASGRDSDIFEYGPGLVLRRTRSGRVIEHEARAIEHARSHGFPAPRVHDVLAGGTEIVMERLDGPLMMHAILRRPYSVARYATILADLHDQLHAIPAPEWLPSLEGPSEGGGSGEGEGEGEGESLLHLDLHPLNVIMTERGPVVIDWSNASRGDPLIDVGITYVLLTCPRVPLPAAARAAVQPLRLVMARAFARRYRGPAFNRQTAAAAEMKARDVNISPDEADNCRRLAARLRSHSRS